MKNAQRNTQETAKPSNREKSHGPNVRHGPGPELMGASTLVGDAVFTGRVGYAVLSFGGFLGMGEKLFAVPWEALSLDTANKRFVLDVDKTRLESALRRTRHDDCWPPICHSKGHGGTLRARASKGFGQSWFRCCGENDPHLNRMLAFIIGEGEARAVLLNAVEKGG